LPWSTKQASLYRYSEKEQSLVTGDAVKDEISIAFRDLRGFAFRPDSNVIGGLRSGAALDSYHARFVDIKNDMYNVIARENHTVRNTLLGNVHLSTRLVNAVSFYHRALAEIDDKNLRNRRAVIIKEMPGTPTIYHISDDTNVLSHVGLGPAWMEIPSVYLGLTIFDALFYETKKNEHAIFDAFKTLLEIEERAVETGYVHIEKLREKEIEDLDLITKEVIRLTRLGEVAYAIPQVKKIKKFSSVNRQKILTLLDARLKDDELNFDFTKNIRALELLERYSRRYKKGDDVESLREVVRLLVAAAGHDFHEIRNRANIALERIFAPKEYDAPLATTFFTVRLGEKHRFRFTLTAGRSRYFIRIYRNSAPDSLPLEDFLDFSDIELRYNGKEKTFEAEYPCSHLGQLDFVVYRRRKNSDERILNNGLSGRINVIPDIRGELLLEIFPDIHGHTRLYWKDPSGNTGLVYNENGEVIRLGNFSDVAAHLNDLKQRYQITALYILGAQKRGKNREDWAPEASSPSPFAPMSLTEMEPSLGGEEAFTELVQKAHSLNIKIIVDVIPHINRKSGGLDDSLSVQCYDDSGNLVVRAATDGRYGSWNDGRLLNYRKFEVWEWLADSIGMLIEKFDIDGIRFDSAHAVPIVMKKNNFPLVYSRRRSHEEMVEGTIIINDREDEHFITTGYYDSACRERIAVPLHYYLSLSIEKKLRKRNKRFFINVAECYWGRERFLTRSGIIPYNSALFKICENITHGKSDVREIYHLYDGYYPGALIPGTELLGILGNHDERRALNTFGLRGLRPAVWLTCFMNNMVMDYEGSAEGQGWKVYLDNIYVNWNQFEFASRPGLEQFYREVYSFHRHNRGTGWLLWTNNTMVAAAMKYTDEKFWIGAFNFSEHSQDISIQFDRPSLPIEDDAWYRIVDPIYSPVTGHYNYFTGRELKVSRIHTTVSYTDRIKFLMLEKLDEPKKYYSNFLKDSLSRFCTINDISRIPFNFFFEETANHAVSFTALVSFIKKHILDLFREKKREAALLGLKRAFFHMQTNRVLPAKKLFEYITLLCKEQSEDLRAIGEYLRSSNKRGAVVFLSAEAEPFSKSGGLANVAFELPRELVRLGEEVYVITPLYRYGDQTLVQKMQDAVKRYRILYTGTNVRFFIQDIEYEVGIHRGDVEGIHFILLDHHEFFDGLYWGYTAEEKLRRRIAFARASTEAIRILELKPLFTLTNDAYTGLINGVVRADPFYAYNLNYKKTSFFHVMHNVGWQYFDSYYRYENGFDLFRLFNLPEDCGPDFYDPVHSDRINCMAAGVRFSDHVITVSPSYAEQIKIASDGLEHILHDVTGISNAVAADFEQRLKRRFRELHFVESSYPLLMDRLEKSPSTKKPVQVRYPEILNGPHAPEKIPNRTRREILIRMRNKLLLQAEKGFDIDPDRVLFAMIHRITEQKGFQLLLEASEGIFKTLRFQGIIGGSVASGDRRAEEISRGLIQLQSYYQKDVSVNIGFQDMCIPLLSCDVFLMPSLYEPGGIVQLEAHLCGCPVVARATGGLRDTVRPIHKKGRSLEGNGWLFSDFTPSSFYDAMERCALFFKKTDEKTLNRVRRGTRKNVFSWGIPARRYLETLYTKKEIIREI